MTESPLGLDPALGRAVLILLSLAVGTAGHLIASGRVHPLIELHTPWTRADREVWRQTHRLGSHVLRTTGLIGIGAAVLLPPALTAAILALAVAMIMAGLTLYSHLAWERRAGRSRP